MDKTWKFTPTLQLGVGGQGTVFLAEAVSRDGVKRTVVLKRQHPVQARKPQARKDFENEARLGLLLRHPCIVRTEALIELDGAPAMVLEHIDGPTLAQALRHSSQPLPPAMAVHIIASIAEALEHARNARSPDGKPMMVLHRDLKPDNIMLDAQGLPRLMDFGIARADFLTQTASGFQKGTPTYMSPEQVRGDEDLTPASDVFSLGVILWECLTGERLFHASELILVLKKILELDVAKVLEALPPSAAAIKPVLARMLAVPVTERFPDAGAAAIALRKVQHALPGAGAEAEQLQALSRAACPNREVELGDPISSVGRWVLGSVSVLAFLLVALGLTHWTLNEAVHEGLKEVALDPVRSSLAVELPVVEILPSDAPVSRSADVAKGSTPKEGSAAGFTRQRGPRERSVSSVQSPIPPSLPPSTPPPGPSPTPEPVQVIVASAPRRSNVTLGSHPLGSVELIGVKSAAGAIRRESLDSGEYQAVARGPDSQKHVFTLKVEGSGEEVYRWNFETQQLEQLVSGHWTKRSQEE